VDRVAIALAASLQRERFGEGHLRVDLCRPVDGDRVVVDERPEQVGEFAHRQPFERPREIQRGVDLSDGLFAGVVLGEVESPALAVVRERRVDGQFDDPVGLVGEAFDGVVEILREEDVPFLAELLHPVGCDGGGHSHHPPVRPD
jgi:hypothetical protein